MIVLGLDFETTIGGKVDPLELRIIEVGAVLWDTERKAPLKMSSHLCWGLEYEFNPMITELTGITHDDLSRYGHAPVTILNGVSSFMLNAECIVAHNGNAFDKPLLMKECERHGVLVPRKHWIDTMTDIPYPESIRTRSLKHLAAEHGFLNPFAHRALFDVMTMLNVMSHYDFGKIVERSQSPRVTVRALTMKPWEDDGVSNAVAKELGFRFDGGRKMWLKTVIESEMQAFYQSAGDRIQMERVDSV